MKIHSAALLSVSQLTACQAIPCSCCWLNSEWGLIPNNCSPLEELQGSSDLRSCCGLLVKTFNISQAIWKVALVHFDVSIRNSVMRRLVLFGMTHLGSEPKLSHYLTAVSGLDINFQCSRILSQWKVTRCNCFVWSRLVTRMVLLKNEIYFICNTHPNYIMRLKVCRQP